MSWRECRSFWFCASFPTQARQTLAACVILLGARGLAVADDCPPNSGKVIVGQVIDLDGHPLSGVKVSSQIDWERRRVWHTDADGGFRAVIAADARRQVGLDLDHPDFMRAHVEWLAGDGKAGFNLPETVTIKLDPGVVIGGVVRGEEGEPIADARVKLNLSHDAERYWIDVRTGSDGRWRGHVPKNMHVAQFWLHHTDYVCVPISYSTPPEGPLHAEQAVTVMKHGKLVQGKVHDSQGKPVANALVLSQPYNVDMEKPADDLTTTRTQDDGTFAIRNLPEGTGALGVYADSYAPEVVPVDVQDAAPAADIELSPAGELHGQIIDENGQPVPDVAVSIGEWQASRAFPLHGEARTDGQGRFELAGLPLHGSFKLSFSKQGFLTTELDGVVASSEPCTFRIARPTTIRGQVLDDETGEPIKNFTVVKGTRWSHTDDVAFEHTDRRSEAIKADDGRFAVALDQTMASPRFPEVAVRVLARGYLPAETEPVAAGDQPVAVILRLERGMSINGRVIDPVGQPAAKAQVAWVGPKRTAFIQYGKFMGGFTYRPEIIVDTDADGRFELPASRDDGLIVVLHESGYIERRRSAHDAASALRLTAWGRVEGRALAGRKPVADTNVVLTRLDPKLSAPGSEVSWFLYQQTHTDGSFAFDFVPSIPFSIAWRRALLASHKTPVNPKAGETVHVQIGGNGGAVTGQLKKPVGLKMDKFTDAFEVGLHCTQVVAYPAEETGVKKDVRRNFVAELKSYGGFTIHDLPAGHYRLEANVHAPVPDESCGLPVNVAAARTEFEIADSRPEVELQLGTIALQLAPGPQVGQAAPELKGKTLKGEPFDLTDLRGKPVLLDFWGTWCGPCKAAMPTLKRLYETFGRDGRITFVGVDLDYTAESAASYVEDHGVVWPQVATGSWGEENTILRDYAVTSVPSFWLIGTDGTIVARDIAVGDLARRIESALRKSKLPGQPVR